MRVVDMTDDDLVGSLGSCAHDLLRARFTMKMNRGGSSVVVRGLRRQIARVKTELRRREIRDGLSKSILERLPQVGGPTGVVGTMGGGFLAGVVDGLQSVE